MDQETLIKSLLERKLVTRAQIDECVREAEDIRRGGAANIPLEEVLIAHDCVSRDQIESITGGTPTEVPAAAAPAALAPLEDDRTIAYPPVETKQRPREIPVPDISEQKTAIAKPAAPEEIPPIVKASMQEPMNHFGKYVRLHQIGRGSLGSVWKCWDTEGRRYVAIKMLR